MTQGKGKGFYESKGAIQCVLTFTICFYIQNISDIHTGNYFALDASGASSTSQGF